MLHLSYSSETVMRLGCQVLLKSSPSNLTGRIHPSHKSNLIKLFTQFRNNVHTYSLTLGNLTLTMNFSNLWKHRYRCTHAFFSHSIKLRAIPLWARCLRSTVTCGKTPLPLFQLDLWRFVAMLLLRSKDQR